MIPVLFSLPVKAACLVQFPGDALTAMGCFLFLGACQARKRGSHQRVGGREEEEEEEAPRWGRSGEQKAISKLSARSRRGRERGRRRETFEEGQGRRLGLYIARARAWG